MDHKTKSVFNGSSLGKQYSAKGILERFEGNKPIDEKHYYQKSISIASENIKKLGSEHLLKTDTLDALLRIQNSTDYIPKQLMQNKKRRLRKGI